MSITIGRAVLPDPSTVAPSGGGVLTLAGVLWSDEADSDDRATYVQMTEMQLLGCVDNPDEDVFPVVWDAEPKWDGFYRVLDASVDYVNDGSGRLAFANYSVTLERVVDSAVAKVEQYNNSLIRTNGHSITSVSHAQRFVIPNIATDSWTTSTFTSIATRPTSDGSEVSCLFTLISLPTSGTLNYWIAPAYHYVGSCRVEYLAADDVWYPLTGRDLPTDSGGRWRISNGAFRFSPTATLGRWDVSVFNGASWESVTVAANSFDGTNHHEVSIGTNVSQWLVPTILTNSPDAVTVSTSGLSSTTGRYDQVFTIRRGDYYVSMTTWGGLTGRPGLRAAATTASTALSTATLGLRATSNDANGNRLVLLSAPACVNDTTNGRIYVNDTSSTNKHTLAFGVEYDGSSAVTRNTAIEIGRQFIAPPLVASKVLKS